MALQSQEPLTEGTCYVRAQVQLNRKEEKFSWCRAEAPRPRRQTTKLTFCIQHLGNVEVFLRDLKGIVQICDWVVLGGKGNLPLKGHQAQQLAILPPQTQV